MSNQPPGHRASSVPAGRKALDVVCRAGGATVGSFVGSVGGAVGGFLVAGPVGAAAGFGTGFVGGAAAGYRHGGKLARWASDE